MNVQETKEQLIAELIRLAFAEDIGDGDHTTLCCIPATEMGKSQLIVKEDGVLAGVEMAERIFHTFDPELKMTTFIHDGAEVKKGDIAFVVEGKVQSLLQTERLMLNVMQRMSGIATTTRKYVKALEGTKTRVLDTRKTTPGLRMVEKEAVKIGGGVNHRIGLFDMILLKDNHVDFAGGIEAAITRCHQYLKEKNKEFEIEIEVRNFDELQEAMLCRRYRPYHAGQLQYREYEESRRNGCRTLRAGIFRWHHIRHASRLCRMRCGLYLSRSPDTLCQGAGYEL